MRIDRSYRHSDMASDKTQVSENGLINQHYFWRCNLEPKILFSISSKIIYENYFRKLFTPACLKSGVKKKVLRSKKIAFVQKSRLPPFLKTGLVQKIRTFQFLQKFLHIEVRILSKLVYFEKIKGLSTQIKCSR